MDLKGKNEWYFYHNKCLELSKEIKIYKNYMSCKKYEKIDFFAFLTVYSIISFSIFRMNINLIRPSVLALTGIGIFSVSLIVKKFAALKIRKKYIQDFNLSESFFDDFELDTKESELQYYMKMSRIASKKSTNQSSNVPEKHNLYNSDSLISQKCDTKPSYVKKRGR